MAQKHRHHAAKKQGPRRGAPHTPVLRAPVVLERKVPVVYGKPFVVLEDSQKGTFVYKDGRWIAHDLTIAECRQGCQVKELQQKINGMTRYEVCLPLPAAT